jgi:hypothetical protein
MKTRDKCAVAGLVLLYIISWGLSLGRLFGIHFWDKRYALEKIQEPADDGFDQGFQEIGESYYSNHRYPWFLPHVIGAVLWWNLYFLQLIPKVRHWKKKTFHRFLGRFLMVVLLIQTISGCGLAATSNSNIILLVSFVLAVAVLFCIIQAWRYAFWRDIPKHRHWVIRVVGYMQTISLQRFWILILIVSHKFGWDGLYPQLDDDAPDEEWEQLVHQMFDDSFVLCILHAFLFTEWYLSADQGMLETPVNNRNKPNAGENDSLVSSADESNKSYGSIDEPGLEKENGNEEETDKTETTFTLAAAGGNSSKEAENT